MSEVTVAPLPTGLVDPSGVPVQSYTPPTNGEVMAEASQKCGTCLGKGHFYQWVKLRNEPCEKLEEVIPGLPPERTGACKQKCRCNPDMQLKMPKVCGCAVRRWQKKTG